MWRGPGFFDSDLSINKNFKITERFVLNLGANFYNIFNHPNFANPDDNLADSHLWSDSNHHGSQTGPYGSFFTGLPGGRIIQFQGQDHLLTGQLALASAAPFRGRLFCAQLDEKRRESGLLCWLLLTGAATAINPVDLSRLRNEREPIMPSDHSSKRQLSRASCARVVDDSSENYWVNTRLG